MLDAYTHNKPEAHQHAYPIAATVINGYVKYFYYTASCFEDSNIKDNLYAVNSDKVVSVVYDEFYSKVLTNTKVYNETKTVVLTTEFKPFNPSILARMFKFRRPSLFFYRSTSYADVIYNNELLSAYKLSLEKNAYSSQEVSEIIKATADGLKFLPLALPSNESSEYKKGHSYLC